MVNKERILLWVEALESGQYQQERSALRQGDGYCCLGVACEVAIANGLPLEVKPVVAPLNVDASHAIWLYDGSQTYLPRAVGEWFGFGDGGWFGEGRLPPVDLSESFVHNPHVGVDVLGNNVAAGTANDSLGWDFATIAAALRKMYLEGEE
jgi:hypothetical protein